MPSDPRAIALALQQSIGNARFQRVLGLAGASSGTRPRTKRKLGSNLQGKTVLQGKTSKGSVSVPVRVIAKRELVPLGQKPQHEGGKFGGFDIETHALVMAQRQTVEQSVVTAVLRDGTGRYHAFETDAKSLTGVVERAPQPDYVVRVLEPLQGAPGKSWAARVREAKANINRSSRWARIWGELMFLGLLTEATGVERAQIAPKPPTSGTQVPPGASPDGLNFAPWLNHANGRTFPPELRAERTGELPRPVIVIGPEAFESPEFVRMTVVHEASHARYLTEVVRLIKRWRKSKTREEFQTWVGRRREVSPEVRLVAETTVPGLVQGGTKRSTTAVSEVFAYLEGITTVFHHLPAAELRKKNSPARTHLLGELTKLAMFHAEAEWNLGTLLEVERGAEKTLLGEVERKLASYVQTLSPEHQAAFRELLEDLTPAVKASNEIPPNVRPNALRFVDDLKSFATARH
jgi:hypothetical protein